MISARETSAGLYGAWRLAHGDRDGLDWFDASPEGAMRSFAAAVLALPIAAMLLGLEMIHQPAEASGARVILVYLIAYGLEWAGVLLVIHWISPMLDCEDRFLRFVPAYNWARVLEMAAFLPAGAIVAAGLGGLLAIVPLVVLCAVVVYHWFVAKAALEITGGQAAFIVALNISIGVVISVWARSLVGGSVLAQ